MTEIFPSKFSQPVEGGTLLVACSRTRHDMGTDLAAPLERFRQLFPDFRRGRFFAPTSYLNPERQTEWAQSRRNLISLLSTLNETQLQHASLSLSHTQSATVAAVYVADAYGIAREVGIDLEPQDRIISELAAKKFMHSPEQTLGLSLLDIWLTKEAAYKADPLSTQTVIADYQITHIGSDNWGEVRGKVPSSAPFRFTLLAWEDYRMSCVLN